MSLAPPGAAPLLTTPTEHLAFASPPHWGSPALQLLYAPLDLLSSGLVISPQLWGFGLLSPISHSEERSEEARKWACPTKSPTPLEPGPHHLSLPTLPCTHANPHAHAPRPPGRGRWGAVQRQEDTQSWTRRPSPALPPPPRPPQPAPVSPAQFLGEDSRLSCKLVFLE